MIHSSQRISLHYQYLLLLTGPHEPHPLHRDPVDDECVSNISNSSGHWAVAELDRGPQGHLLLGGLADDAQCGAVQPVLAVAPAA